MAFAPEQRKKALHRPSPWMCCSVVAYQLVFPEAVQAAKRQQTIDTVPARGGGRWAIRWNPNPTRGCD